MLIAALIFRRVKEVKSMSRYQQASHVFWRCQYHIVLTPKYRFRILKDNVGKEVWRCIQVYSAQLGCEVVELNVQIDHVHLVIKVPPKISISKLMGALKGKIALKLFSKFPHLRKNKMWGMNRPEFPRHKIALQCSVLRGTNDDKTVSRRI